MAVSNLGCCCYPYYILVIEPDPIEEVNNVNESWISAQPYN